MRFIHGFVGAIFRPFPIVASCLLLTAAMAAGPNGERTPSDAADGSSPPPRPVAAEELAINAEEMASGVGVRVTPTTDPQAHAPVLDAFQERLQEILGEERADVARLRTRIAETSDPLARLRLEGEVAERRLQTEVSLLQLQLERARAQGRDGDVERIEAGLREMLEPAPFVPTSEKRERAGR